MRKNLKKLLKDKSGVSEYIEFTFVFILLVFLIVAMVGLITAISTRLRMDNKLDDIVRIVEITGKTKSDAITKLEEQLTALGGGKVTYSGEFLDEASGLVQLNTTILIEYSSEHYEALHVADFIIETPINLSRPATSMVYHKVENGRVD